MEKKKNNVWGFIAVLLIGVLLGFGLGYFLVWITDNYFGSEMKYGLKLLIMLLILAGFYLALVLQLIAHEAGHLLFGLMTGYKFSSFRIFNFIWVKLDGKVRCKRLTIAGTAGQCLMEPPEMKDGKIPVVLYNLGGVFVNFILAAITGVIAIFCKVPVIFVACILLSLVGIMLALTNGIPLRVGQVDNDGANTVSLCKHKEAAKSFWLQMKINAENAKGKRLREMPAEWFDFPTEGLENSMIASQGVMVENYAMDCQEFDKAKEIIEKLLQKEVATIGLHEDLLSCDRLYIALVVENDRQKVEEIWTKKFEAFRKTMKKFPTVIRTNFVYACLYEGDQSKAASVLEEFEKMAKSYPYANDVASERELLQLAMERLNARREETSTGEEPIQTE